MRIAPRTLLCASAFRVGGSGAETGFDELRELCDAAGDKRSLAIGMTGLIAQQFTAHHAEASDLATEQIRLLEAIDDPALTVGFADRRARRQASGRRVARSPAIGGSRRHPSRRRCHHGQRRHGIPVGNRVGLSRHRSMGFWAAGLEGRFRQQRFALARDSDVATLSAVMFFVYATAVPWILPADATALRDTEEALERAQRSGDDLALDLARCARGTVLVFADGPAA